MAIVFYSNNTNQAETDHFCGSVPTSATQSWDLKDSGAPVTNDEARSCSLLDIPAGTTITVYDSPSEDTGDDYTQIQVLSDIVEYTISTFENSFSDTYVSVTFTKHNGLDGKVSAIKVVAS